MKPQAYTNISIVPVVHERGLGLLALGEDHAQLFIFDGRFILF